MSNHVEKPKRASDKRKYRPIRRWQMLLVAGVLIFGAVWGINAASPPHPIGWWITKTVEMQATYHEAAVATAAAFFEPTKTAYAATAQADLTTQLSPNDEFDLTATMFVFQVTQTAYTDLLEYNLSFSDTQSVTELEQTAYAYRLETRIALTSKDTSSVTPDAKNP